MEKGSGKLKTNLYSMSEFVGTVKTVVNGRASQAHNTTAAR